MSLRASIAFVTANNHINDDNLAIILCTYFDDHPDKPENDPATENGWSEWVEEQCEKVLTEIVTVVEKGQ